MPNKARKGLPKRATSGKGKWKQYGTADYQEKVRQTKLNKVLQSCGPKAAAQFVKDEHATKGDLEMVVMSENSLSAKAAEALKMLDDLMKEAK